jgi:hypothetical protein
MESIIITPIIFKFIEIIGTIGGGLCAAYLAKKIKDKYYNSLGCNSKCIITCESIFNKTNELVRSLSNKNS